MQQAIDWQDLKLFAAIARGGGLAPAARECGVSAATLGRRMTGLETIIGDRLFERGSRGYSLTEAGEVLLDHVVRMEDAASDITRWTQGESAVQPVRISAGGWTMQHLVENLSCYWNQSSGWVPEFVIDYARRDISRREIDIGLRRGRPTEAWLAGRRAGTVDYAIYRAATSSDSDESSVWVSTGAEHANAPTSDWDRHRHGAELTISVNAATSGLPLVRQGIARMAIPCFIGDADPDLVRDGELLTEFRHERWLVVHHEHRHREHVRAAIEALAAFLTSDGSGQS